MFSALRPLLSAAVALAWLPTLHAQAPEAAKPDAPAIYQQHCAVCHGAQRTGLMGPALLPESLERVIFHYSCW